mgnify:CR=1 FL=1
MLERWEGVKNGYQHQNEKAQGNRSGPARFQGPGYSQERILTFQRYAKRRDLLSTLLKDGQEYTHDQVQSLIDNFFTKGKVK